MACPKGGSHNWRNVDRPYKDGSVLQQCRKCSQFRESHFVLKLVVVGIVLTAIVFGIIYYFENNPQ